MDVTRATGSPLGKISSSPEVTRISPSSIGAPWATYCKVNSLDGPSPLTMPCVRFFWETTGMRLLGSVMSRTVAAVGEMRSTRPTTPSGETTGVLTETPRALPLSMRNVSRAALGPRRWEIIRAPWRVQSAGGVMDNSWRRRSTSEALSRSSDSSFFAASSSDCNWSFCCRMPTKYR